MIKKNVNHRKKNSRSLFYRISAWLHLWLGLITGIIMIIVCLTGCIWVFQDEIKAYFLEPETRVSYQDQPVISPLAIHKTAKEHYPDKHISYAYYQQNRAVYVGLGEGRKISTALYLDPYNGNVLKEKHFQEGEVDFFRFILNGHRFLWLPWEIGRPVVNYSTLIFIITLISGMVLWWPKKWNKSTRRKSFYIRWNGTAKRINYDLHNVVGFYSLLILFAICCTGMVYGIEWFSRGLYWSTSGGQSLPEYTQLKSDSLQKKKFFHPEEALDLAWQKVVEKHPEAQGFYYTFPDTAKAEATISISIYPTARKYYNRQSYIFDQYTLEQLPGQELYDGSFEEASFGDKLRKMNYDIHVGSILGFPGKVIAFFASLIGATLPVTGFIIWLGKKKKKPKKKRAPAREEVHALTSKY